VCVGSLAGADLRGIANDDALVDDDEASPKLNAIPGAALGPPLVVSMR
jgi:hypothetical protein